jgi:hypothetical protein
VWSSGGSRFVEVEPVTVGRYGRRVTLALLRDEQGLSRVVKNLKFLTSPQDLFE